MECAIHPERNSVGYCKKCGKFGCEECLVKVAIKGPVGTQSKATEALVCRECLGKARPDLMPPQLDKKSARTSSRPAQVRRSRKGAGKLAAVAAALILVAAGIAAAVMYLPRANISHQMMTADEVVTEALDALSAGNIDKFLSCVDVTGFVCRMDSTGLTIRDYEEAGRERKKELLDLHCNFLIKDFFVSANMRKEYSVVGSEIDEDSASIYVKPWIRFGNRLYKRLLLKKKMGHWQISGLASPDY